MFWGTVPLHVPTNKSPRTERLNLHHQLLRFRLSALARVSGLNLVQINCLSEQNDSVLKLTVDHVQIVERFEKLRLADFLAQAL
jgi:hypothetical protein